MEETGMNSVRPSMRPRMITASHSGIMSLKNEDWELGMMRESGCRASEDLIRSRFRTIKKRS